MRMSLGVNTCLRREAEANGSGVDSGNDEARQSDDDENEEEDGENGEVAWRKEGGVLLLGYELYRILAEDLKIGKKNHEGLDISSLRDLDEQVKQAIIIRALIWLFVMKDIG
ncbi:hypothetical protein HDE_12229 [Halotydeus destructor]|nr:hypothetical protein HDE_12229 [Halotydeus destructor]